MVTKCSGAGDLQVLRWRCFGGSFSSSGVNVHRRARVYNLFVSVVKGFNRRGESGVVGLPFKRRLSIL